MPDSTNSPPDPDLPRSRAPQSLWQASPVEASPTVETRQRKRLVTPVVLFVLTVASVFVAGAVQVGSDFSSAASLLSGWVFAVPLLSILLAHELGHYVAARVHGVSASLPYFIPMPASPFGTMGAVIVMRGRIASRKALLDIGAAGPLAGLAIAIPVLVWGLLHSEVKRVTGSGIQEGQCLLYLALKRLSVGPIPVGHDVFLHPAAFAGWTGLLVTMINLLPVAQLDGGHVAYSLFGPTQNRLARAVHALLPVLFLVSVGSELVIHGSPEAKAGAVGLAVKNSFFWLIWFVLLFVLRWLGGRDHPPTEPGELGPVRKAVAVGTLVLFVLLFMPTPMAQY